MGSIGVGYHYIRNQGPFEEGQPDQRKPSFHSHTLIGRTVDGRHILKAIRRIAVEGYNPGAVGDGSGSHSPIVAATVHHQCIVRHGSHCIAPVESRVSPAVFLGDSSVSS